MHSFRPLTRAAVAALVVTGLALSGASASYAEPERPPTTPQPTLPEQSQGDENAALQALANAQAALAGEGELEPTEALVDLAQALPDLEGDDLVAARSLLARPTDANPAGWEADYGTVREARPVCGPHVCVHYVRSGPHRPPLADRDGDRRPDWVEANLAVMERSWNVEVGALGYRAPRRDGSRGTLPGNRSTAHKIDVYLAQLEQGLFGYAAPEPDPARTSDGLSRTASGHMVLDADFAGFACTRSACLRATGAHEFFHLVQFAYDSFEASWFMESTATWMEERVFDSTDDNRSYVASGSLRNPSSVPLDSSEGGAPYGNWVFHELYTQQLHDNGIVRQAWYAARAGGGTSARYALGRALVANGTTLREMFGLFGAASNVPPAFWSEGAAYPVAQVTATQQPTATFPLFATAVVLQHLTSANYRFDQRAGVAPGAVLEVTVNAPDAAGSTATLLVHRAGGVTVVPLPLDVAGDATVQVDFDPDDVSFVTLNVGNAAVQDWRRTTFEARYVNP